MFDQRKKIWRLWWVCSLIIFLVLLFWTIQSRFVGNLEYVWGKWFTTIIVSNLLIIVSTFIFDEQAGISNHPPKSQFLFRLCFSFCFIFLMLPLLAIFVWPMTDNGDPLTTMKQVGRVSTTVEPLMATTLGVFFYSENIKSVLGKKPKDE